MGLIHEEKTYGLTIRESANDGSDFSNPVADYRVLFLGEDGLLYVRDSAGTVTHPYGSGFSDPMTTRGDIIVRNSSNVTARLAVGVANRVLTSDGTDPAWAQVTPAMLDVSADDTTANATSGHHGLLPKLSGSGTDVLKGDGTWGAAGGGGSGALALLEQYTASSSATINFTTGITSTYDEYLLEMIEIIPATDGSDLQLLASTNGGSSYLGAASYQWNTWIVWNSSPTNYGNSSDSKISVHGYVATGFENTAAEGGYSGSIKLFNPLGTTSKKRLTIDGSALMVDGNFGRSAGAARILTTSAVNALRFQFASGNIASGIFRLYGIAKS